MHAENSLPDLPPYSLDVQAMDLGLGVKAVGLELIETESREPLRGPEAATIWAPAIREATSRCVVVPAPSEKLLRLLVARFASETFGLRVGPAAAEEDAELEAELSHRGLDAYQAAYSRYTCCAIFEPDDGWVTLLSDSLWPSEVIRRVRPALQPFDVYIARPQ
jgi:hypothetical protein